MTEEEFMKDITWLDMLKLKGSWGTLGNQNMDKAYPAEPLLENAFAAVFGKPASFIRATNWLICPTHVSVGRK